MVRWLLCAALLWIAVPAWAHENECPAAGVDGQRVAASAATTESAGKIASETFQQTAYWLCCNTGVAACADKDVGGAADAVIVSLEDIGTCTGVDVTIGFRNDASGTNHTVGTLSIATSSLVIPRPANRFVTATVNTMAGCGADNADVRVDVLQARP